MRQRASIVGRRGGARGSVGGGPAVPDLPTVERAPHRGSPGQAGGWRRGRGGGPGGAGNAVRGRGGGGEAVG